MRVQPNWKARCESLQAEVERLGQREAAARDDGLRRGAELVIETLEEQVRVFEPGSRERHYLDQIIDGVRVGLAAALVQAEAGETRNA